MLVSLKREYAQLVTSGGQLLLLLVGIKLESYTGWLWCLGAMAFISLFAWYSALHRLRMVDGTPTSRIASAAQGYAELIGNGEPHGGPVLARYSMTPCLWCRHRLEKRNSDNKGWHTVESGETTAPFEIDDGTGRCVIDPEHAEILTQHKTSWTNGDTRQTEWMLLEGDDIYVLGEFKTVGGSTVSITHEQLVKDVLSEWKMDNENLMKRFDLDNNGVLDIREWGLARSAAKREAEKRLNELHSEPDTNFMLKPSDGRLYLISNLDQDALTWRYRLWTWLHLSIMFGALIALGWLLQQEGI